MEVLVEPFRENNPGPHVLGAIRALESAGLTVDMGAFSSSTQGSPDAIADAVAELIRVGFSEGATAIQLRIERR